MTRVTVVLRAEIEVDSLNPADHKEAYENIEEAIDKLNELGSCSVVSLTAEEG